MIAGGYRVRESSDPRLVLVGQGAVMPEVLAAAETLEKEGGINTDVICITSADLLYRALHACSGLEEGDTSILDELFPNPLPILTLIDGHPHALSFLGAIHNGPITCLGVTKFGQSGDVQDVYEHHGLDAETVIGAALDLIS